MTFIISCLDGIGIYFIIPLLGSIQVIGMQSVNQIPVVSSMLAYMQSLHFPVHLPVILAIYVVVVGGQAILQKQQTVMNASMMQAYIRTLRNELYRGLLSAKWEFYLSRRKSDFNQVLADEMERVTYAVGLSIQMVLSFAFTAIQIGLACWISPLLTAVVLLFGGLLALFSRKFMHQSKRLGEKTTELSQKYYAGIYDHFSGIKDIKSNQLEQPHIYWFNQISRNMENNAIQMIKMNTTSQLIYKLASLVLIAGFVYLALNVFYTSPEQLIVTVLILSRLWPRFVGIQNNFEQLYASFSAFRTVRELQADYAEQKEPGHSHGGSSGRPEPGAIQCTNVYYRYNSNDSHYALKAINLYIPAKKMTAIVGKSGAGKSTLVDLLMGLIHPESGQVYYAGGSLLEEQQLLALRSAIGYVPQDPFLFHDSIRENLKLVDPYATDRELWEALRFSASEEFVRNLPDGLDTVIGDRGIRLSGGERQRIVLARAILKKPAILVLDEATSALDSENERRIQAALDGLKGQMTIIVIAHRLSTIRHADQVIVLEKGEIIQQGGYEQLAQESKGVFKQLLNYQTGA
nr:ABC transporter ATP-binding protein [Paenibacillus protaetiae]